MVLSERALSIRGMPLKRLRTPLPSSCSLLLPGYQVSGLLCHVLPPWCAASSQARSDAAS